MKRTISIILSALILLSFMTAIVPSVSAQDSSEEPFAEGIALTGADKSVEDYSYRIFPLLSPFNELFFVKTDNPDPKSFAFADKDTVYSESGDTISLNMNWQNKTIIYADVVYDDPEAGRVNGGYIFKSENYDTDGGSVVLQKKVKSGYWDYKLEDTSVTLTLPRLKDNTDYLIDKFADKSAFFDNMSAVQDGFEDISFYSGSSIRGELSRDYDYWSAAVAGHKDQSFYIYSPYSRKDNRSLLASALYPYRYDSLGFPGKMAQVSQRLDSSSSYQWNPDYHWLVDVTYNGETRSFGGQGTVEGKTISEDKITRYFTLDENDLSMTPEEAYALLYSYSQTEMDDDIPRDDALTWDFICDTVGSGAWVKLANGYTYLYTRENSDSINADEWGVGNSIYWGGKMGYFRETWVDGRYITDWRRIEQGAKFEDHPNASIYLKNVTIPLVTLKSTWIYDPESQSYKREVSVNEITEAQKDILFEYNSENDIWTATLSGFGYQYANYRDLKNLVDEGKLDKKYLDMASLTREEVQALNIDKNSDHLPWQGYLFDGTVEPGTPFGFDYLIGDSDGNGEIEITDATILQRFLLQIKTPCSDEELIRGDADRNGSIELPDATYIQYYLAEMNSGFKVGKPITEA